MQTAAFESAWPVVADVKWVRIYFAQIASPLTPVDVAVGHFLFVAASGVPRQLRVLRRHGRSSARCSRGRPCSPSPRPCSSGLAFATPVTAFSVSRESEQGLSAMFRFVIVPLFLFSGTFFPVTQLPPAIRWIAYVTPLWHGVMLCRGLALGTISALAVAGHTTVLVIYIVVGAVHGLRPLPPAAAPT